jgi:hypothetical protein
MSDNKRSGESALSWSQPALDAICQQVPEFESLLIVFRDATAFKWAASLVRQSLIPNSARAGIQMSEILLTRENLEAYEDRLKTEMQDAVVAVSSDSDRDRMNHLCAHLIKLPVAVIGLFHHLPTRWELYFDACIEIADSAAVIRWRDGRSEIRMPFATDDAVVPQPIIGAPKSRLCVIDRDDKFEQLLKRVLPPSSCEIKTVPLDSRELEDAALILYCEGWEPESSPKEVQTLSKLTTVFITSPTPLRADDRIAAYRAGARIVFAHQPTIEEVSSAIMSYLFPRSTVTDPFARLDAEFNRLSARVKRETYWRKSELSRALPVYQPMIANHFRRAKLLDAEVVAVAVKLPTAPKEIVAAGWDTVFQRALVGTLMGTLRNRDVAFVVDDRLVVVAHAVHNIAARPILRRMSVQLQELKAAGAQADVIRRPWPESGDSVREAEELVRILFDEKKLNFQPIEKLLA